MQEWTSEMRNSKKTGSAGVLMRMVAVLAFVLLWSAAARADANMRCGKNVVRHGMTTFEVFERCGSPLVQRGFEREIQFGVWIPTDEWLYQQGINRFRRLLTFEHDRLVDIELRPKPLRPLRSRTAARESGAPVDEYLYGATGER